MGWMRERAGCVWTVAIVLVGVVVATLWPRQWLATAGEVGRFGDQLVGELERTVARATVAPVELVDGAGRAYRAEGASGLAFGQVTSLADHAGRLRIVGELRNVGDGEASFVAVLATLYRADGSLLDADRGVMELEVLEPGRSSPFEVWTDVAAGDVGRYVLQVNP